MASVSDRISIQSSGKDPWEDFPGDLANMIQTVFRTDGEYCVEDTIRYLMNHTVSEYERRGNAKLRYLMWTVRFFDAMYPLYIRREDSWKLYGKDIKTILEEAERYLFDLAGDKKVITESQRSEFGFGDETDLANIAQRMDLYFCTVHKFLDEEDEYRQRLRKLLEDTKRNAGYLICRDNAEKLSEFDWKGSNGFYLHSFDFWQPIEWLYHEADSMEIVSDLIAIYEEYIEYLFSFRNYVNIGVRNKLIIGAESNLQWLYQDEFDIMEDEERIPANQYAEYLAELERKISESEIRLAGLKENNHLTASVDDEEYRNRFYHKNWKGFTNRLRSLMEEHPSMPVVVFSQTEDGETQRWNCNCNLTRCEVAVAHDPETGEPSEKIIAVIVSDPGESIEDFLNSLEEDLPF